MSFLTHTSKDYNDGAQDNSPQNTPSWHIDYFELKLLDKQRVQEGHFEPLLCPPESRNSLSWEGALPTQGGRETS